MIDSRTARQLIATFALTGALVGSNALAEQHPNLESGFSADKAYQFGDVDSVDLFSGRLTIQIPIGSRYQISPNLSYGLVLTYNSNIWDFKDNNNAQGPCTEANLSDESNAGAGWILKLASLEYENFGTGHEWRFLGPDGADHKFYGSAHIDQPEPEGDWAVGYTRDDTYMRLTIDDNAAPYRLATVEMPNGNRYVFEDPLSNRRYRLKTMTDAVTLGGNYVNRLDITYRAEGDDDRDPRARWELTDTLGRKQDIYFRSAAWGGDEHDIVDEVVLTAPGGKHLTYTFNYNDSGTNPIPMPTRRSTRETCRTTSSGDWMVDLTALMSVTAADDSQQPPVTLETWQFLGYHLYGATDPVPSVDLPGVIGNMIYPTGGEASWTLTNRELMELDRDEIGCLPTVDPENCKEFATNRWATGVATRNVDGGTWTYDSYSTSLFEQQPTRTRDTMDELVTRVTSPVGDTTLNYFTTYLTWAAYETWDYNLPFTRNRSEANLSLSSETYKGNVDVWCPTSHNLGEPGCHADNPPAGSLLRAEYIRYDGDSLDASGYGFSDNNRRIVAQRRKEFEYDANGNTTKVTNADTKSSRFDGLGHYRQADLQGDFDRGNTRTTTTSYNDGYPDYPPADPENWAPPTTWLLGTYTYQEESEGTQTMRTEYCFDPVTGFLRAKRSLMGSTAGDHDLLAVFTADSNGEVWTEQYAGGDSDTSPGTSTYCGATPWLPLTDAKYTLQHVNPRPETQWKRQSWYWGDQGGQFGPLVVDQDVDANTGLVTTSRDTAGVSTSYAYDVLGRLISVTPQGGAETTYTYSLLNGATIPTVTVETLASQGGNPKQIYTYDGFGRLVKEQKRLYNGNWGERQTQYNAMGWKQQVSEWEQTPSHWTIFSNFDPFGRAGTIQAPDGWQTTVQYEGSRQVIRAVKVARTLGGGEADAKTTETYDRQGRLISVKEPSGSSGTDVTTTYTYDVGNHLATVTSDAGSQSRTFNYDLRGLLTWEDVPEKTGTTTCADSSSHDTCYLYDARGHVTDKRDGISHLAFAYDRAERLADVDDAAANANLKHFEFAYANVDLGGGVIDYANGKLHESTRHNRFDPAHPSVSFDVSQTYTYAGLGGRVSARVTGISRTDIQYAQTFTQGFTWDDLGNLAGEAYPQITDNGPTRTVTNVYAYGYLTAVPGFANSMTYSANGMVASVAHSNGVTDTTVADSTGMARPSRFYTDGAFASGTTTPSNWSSGTYNYDGAGNIKSMLGNDGIKAGNDLFSYDGVSRIAEADLAIDSQTRKQQYTFDAFGNLTKISTDGGHGIFQDRRLDTDIATNHLTDDVNADNQGTYDGAGNLTRWNRHDAGVVNDYSYYSLGDMQWSSRSGHGYTYAYDADGERVASNDDHFSGDTGGILYTLRGLDGKVRREYTEVGGTWTWTKDVIYRDGALLASVGADTGRRHFHLDHLGTPRLVTDRCGAVTSRHTYYPFGEDALDEIALYGSQVPERMRFTGHERDLAATSTPMDDLDYMHARYYSPVLGRFLSVDQVGSSVVPSHSMSWNRFSYVGNRPLLLVDPKGAREVTTEEESLFDRLINLTDDEATKMAVMNAVSEIVEAIAAVKQGSDDPVSLRTSLWALGQLGNPEYGQQGDLTSGAFKAGPGSWKCNLFVANAFIDGGGLPLGPLGYPVGGSNMSDWAHLNAPTANQLGGNAAAVGNLHKVSSAQIGDVVSWPTTVGSGHTSLYIGGGVVIYASTHDVKVNTISGVDYGQPVVRRFLPWW